MPISRERERAQYYAMVGRTCTLESSQKDPQWCTSTQRQGLLSKNVHGTRHNFSTIYFAAPLLLPPLLQDQLNVPNPFSPHTLNLGCHFWWRRFPWTLSYTDLIKTKDSEWKTVRVRGHLGCRIRYPALMWYVI